jgi:two-component system, chemotaxis family, sensor kinase CheA
MSMDKHQDAYRAEAAELLIELENSLIELEQRPADAELIGRVFRAMHTIKGSGAMFGFDSLAAFTHDVETVFDQVRNGRIAVTTNLVNLALQARDHIKALLEENADETAGRRILEDFQAILAAETDSATVRSASDVHASCSPPVPQDCDDYTYHIRFKPHLEFFRNGSNPLLLLEELRNLGPCRISAQTDQLPVASGYDPEACYLYWDIVLTTPSGLNAIRDVFIFVEDRCELTINVIDSGDTPGGMKEGYKRLGEILLDRGDLSASQLEEALSRQRRLGEVLVEANIVDPAKVCAALAEQAHVKAQRLQNRSEIEASVRVPAEKLDSLVDLVGELVTIQARLSQKAARSNDPDMTVIAEIVERLSAEMRDTTLSIRMLPIGGTFNKLRRLVRDLSNDLGKDVALVTEGGETELDKTVIEQLNDPLVHIIRNCIDHGIESPEARRGAGKLAHGTIRMAAGHSGANVLIEISDDGAGLDCAHIRRKAIEKGLLAPDAEKSEKELFNLIFAPGFSTSECITSVSGRGVGMDVVKSHIENLRGSIELRSRPGEGTTIILKLPLTLAIIDGLLVSVDDSHYVLPLSSIEECVELPLKEAECARVRRMLEIRGQIVPYVHLRDHFGIQAAPPAIQQVVINSVNGQRLGIVVDRVIGEHQIVIKTMSRMYRDVAEIAGATILGDGTVALILDLSKLVESVDQGVYEGAVCAA